MKIAPIVRALQAKGAFSTRLIHTGQHYDFAMDRVFFDELRSPGAGCEHLKIGSAPAGEQVARIMLALQPLFTDDRPDLLIVVGDVNSTVAGALSASYLRIPVAHVEAGLRSFDREMPEEFEPARGRPIVGPAFRLRAGGRRQSRSRAGRARADQIRRQRDDRHAVPIALARAAAPATTFASIGASEAFVNVRRYGGFGFATLHRPSNVDDPEKLRGLVEALAQLARSLPIVFAVHPRTARA